MAFSTIWAEEAPEVIEKNISFWPNEFHGLWYPYELKNGSINISSTPIMSVDKFGIQHAGNVRKSIEQSDPDRFNQPRKVDGNIVEFRNVYGEIEKIVVQYEGRVSVTYSFGDVAYEKQKEIIVYCTPVSQMPNGKIDVGTITSYVIRK